MAREIFQRQIERTQRRVHATWSSSVRRGLLTRAFSQDGTSPFSIYVTLSAQYRCHFYCRRVRNFRFGFVGALASPLTLLTLSRKASAFGFPVFKPRSYPDYERVLHEECSPSELHSRVPGEARILRDELRYILEAYGNTRHGYRSLYRESATE